MSKLNIESLNDKGQKHGYWEEYYLCGQLNFKCKYVNDDRHGYFEKYWSN
jgi:antitoxin component YwqK of YwqJK toxin-antitoxin module